MEKDLEEVLEQADSLKISLSVLKECDGVYLPQEREILLNPCTTETEFGITFLHEMFHHWAYINDTFQNRRLEEYYAEKYGQEMYGLYPNEINEYLKGRNL